MKYKILQFVRKADNNDLRVPSDRHIFVNQYDLKGYLSRHNTNAYLNDDKHSVKDNTFTIHSILVQNDDETVNLKLAVNDSFNSSQVFSIDYYFNDRQISIMLKNGIKLNLGMVYQLLYDSKSNNNTIDNSNTFTINEIEEVLSTFLDEPEVKEALVEFNNFKLSKKGDKVVNSNYKLPEKFYFKLSKDTIKWVNHYKQNSYDYNIHLNGENEVFCFPYYDENMDTNIHLAGDYNIDRIKGLGYIDVSDNFDEVLKKYPLPSEEEDGQDLKMGTGIPLPF